MLLADIDAEGWKQIITTLGGQVVIVLGAYGLLRSQLNKVRHSIDDPETGLKSGLKANTEFTQAAAEKSALASDKADTAAKKADTAAQIGQETAETAKKIEMLVNGNLDALKAELAAAKAELARYRSPRP